jgi:hypothetical protein
LSKRDHLLDGSIGLHSVGEIRDDLDVSDDVSKRWINSVDAGRIKLTSRSSSAR